MPELGVTKPYALPQLVFKPDSPASYLDPKNVATGGLSAAQATLGIAESLKDLPATLLKTYETAKQNAQNSRNQSLIQRRIDGGDLSGIQIDSSGAAQYSAPKPLSDFDVLMNDAKRRNAEAGIKLKGAQIERIENTPAKEQKTDWTNQYRPLPQPTSGSPVPSAIPAPDAIPTATTTAPEQAASLASFNQEAARTVDALENPGRGDVMKANLSAYSAANNANPSKKFEAPALPVGKETDIDGAINSDSKEQPPPEILDGQYFDRKTNTVLWYDKGTLVRKAFPNPDGSAPSQWEELNKNQAPLKPSEKISAQRSIRSTYHDMPSTVLLFGRGSLMGIDTIKTKLDSLLSSVGGDFSKLSKQDQSTFVNQMNKLNDPNSAVLLSEYKATADTLGLLDRFELILKKAADGDRLLPQQAEEIATTLNTMHAAAKKQYLEDVPAIVAAAKEIGSEPRLVGIPAKAERWLKGENPKGAQEGDTGGGDSRSSGSAAIAPGAEPTDEQIAAMSLNEKTKNVELGEEQLRRNAALTEKQMDSPHGRGSNPRETPRQESARIAKAIDRYRTIKPTYTPKPDDVSAMKARYDQGAYTGEKKTQAEQIMRASGVQFTPR